MITSTFVPDNIHAGDCGPFGESLYNTISKNISRLAGKFYSILTIEEKDGKLFRTRDGNTTAFAYCGGTRFLSYDPEKDYDQGVRHEFLIRDGRAWGVRCGTRVFERKED